MRRTGTYGFAQCRYIGPRETCHDRESRVGRRSLLVVKPRFQGLDVSATHDRGYLACGNPIFEGNTRERSHKRGKHAQHRFLLAGGFIHFVAVLSSYITLGTSSTYVN
jgi:hypothetical protein